MIGNHRGRERATSTSLRLQHRMETNAIRCVSPSSHVEHTALCLALPDASLRRPGRGGATKSCLKLSPNDREHFPDRDKCHAIQQSPREDATTRQDAKRFVFHLLQTILSHVPVLVLGFLKGRIVMEA